MRHADSNTNTHPKMVPATIAVPPDSAHAIPTFIATDLLEKLILDRDASAVRRVVTEGRHN